MTSCWGDGTAGPLFMNVPRGEYSQAILNDFNEAEAEAESEAGLTASRQEPQ